MAAQTSTISRIAALFTPVNRDGHKFVALAAVITVVLFLLSSALGVLGALCAAAIMFFFRDPERVIPEREGLVLAPADGTVLQITKLVPPMELGLGSEPIPCVSIFLSLLDVHVNRAPIAGRIAAWAHQEGFYHPADTQAAQDENERQALTLESDTGAKIGVVLIAGAVARRIVMFVKEGDRVHAGSRIGIIRFGSRADIYLPGNIPLLVAEGQRVIAGETVLADRSGRDAPISFRRD